MSNYFNPYLQSYNDNSFIGYYINNYNDVLNMAVPSNRTGSPIRGFGTRIIME